MHMLLVALSTIYQGKKPIINYTAKHAYVLSRAHLHYELTGNILPSVKDIVDILMLHEIVSYPFVHDFIITECPKFIIIHQVKD